ncbi:MAG: elongation factor 4, partial [Dehalococcoidia bacterium]|nr:elongation factor 4 [Dehalococcoidia bacterium]
EVVFTSAKEGLNTDQVLSAVVERIPPPAGNPEAPLKALVFDSKYDVYKGVMAYVRVIDGRLSGRRLLRLMHNNKEIEPLELGVFRPWLEAVPELGPGEVGYVATGLKDVRESRVGDTITHADEPASEPLPGYAPPKPMVFAGLYPTQSNDYEELRDAMEKLNLNDASFVYQPENSVALGPGFRAGFLGLLHMEIVQERLEREFDIELLATAPSVEYQVTLTTGEEVVVDNPAELPAPNYIQEVREPWMDISVIVPDRHIGAVMELVTARRGEFKGMEYMAHEQDGRGGAGRVVLKYSMPLSEMLGDFYDRLKSGTQGYASLDYSFSRYVPAKLVKLEILVNSIPVDALSLITHADRAPYRGRDLVGRLKDVVPRQMFDVPLQAAIGGRIVARETIRAMRKNVLAKCYGGDISRKRKLLQRQARGKKRMKMVGNVEIPQEAFMAILELER